MSNWIKLSRNIANNDIWHLEPFTKAQAWIDILMLTNYKDSHLKLKNGQLVKIQRGQCGWSKLKLAKRWQWSRNKVTRFFDYLFEQEMIQQTSIENTTIITVLNYDRYQNDTTNETTNDTTNDTTNETLIKKVKKENAVAASPISISETVFLPEKIFFIYSFIGKPPQSSLFRQVSFCIALPKTNQAARHRDFPPRAKQAHEMVSFRSQTPPQEPLFL